jgi:hypothetical protein
LFVSVTVIVEDAQTKLLSVKVILLPPFKDNAETLGDALPTATEVLAVSALTIEKKINENATKIDANVILFFSKNFFIIF